MYFVVLWDEWSATIPSSWLIVLSKAFKWPPKEKNASVESKKNSLPNNDWDIIHYKKLLGPFDTYKKAREFEIEITNISTNDEETLSTLKEKMYNKASLQKRQINKPPRYCTTSSSEEEKENENLDNTAKKRINKLSTYHENDTSTKIKLKEICIPQVPINYKPTIRKVEAISSAQHKISKKSAVDCKFGASIHEKQRCSELKNGKQVIENAALLDTDTELPNNNNNEEHTESNVLCLDGIDLDTMFAEKGQADVSNWNMGSNLNLIETDGTSK
ncbi:uncharacterized protein LOC143902144 isoform X2 [Temnothorax americanus]